MKRPNKFVFVPGINLFQASLIFMSKTGFAPGLACKCWNGKPRTITVAREHYLKGEGSVQLTSSFRKLVL
jgi:hypothetical protein